MKLLIIPLLIFHWLDALFTYLLLKKEAKRWENPEELEMTINHKFFMKKFGIKKGVIISVFITSLIIGTLSWFAEEQYMIFAMGIFFAMAFINYKMLIEGDDIMKRLKKKRKKK